MAGTASDGQELELLKTQNVSENLFDEGGDDLEDGTRTAADGMLNVWQTALAISGATAGYGFLAIELLVISTGWVGFAVFCFLFAATVFTSLLLGRCWNMVRGRWGSERHPYGAIGYEAFGGWARSLINFLVAASSFTAGITVILACAETTLILGGPALHGTFCLWPVIYSTVLCPIFWLGTPKDFWWILATSCFTVVLSILLIIISILVSGFSGARNATNTTQDAPQETELLRVAEMASVLILVLGLQYSLPTLQQDMQRPQSFSKAVIIANSLTLVLALLVMLSLYIVYGNTLTNVTGDATVLTLLPEDALKSTSAALILVHLASCVLLLNNPLFQYLEEVLDIPTAFGWKRVSLRSSVLLAQLFVQETLPHFTLMSSIITGLLTPLLVFLLPPLCYLRLQSQASFSNKSLLSLLETAVCWILIGTTPFIMAITLFVTGSEMVRGRTVFTVPCYFNATLAHV